MQTYFYRLADAVTARLAGDEVLLCDYAGEVSDFIRFNRAKVRQAGSVTQHFLTLRLVRGRRQASLALGLSAASQTDLPRVHAGLEALREVLDQVPEDPHLLYATEVHCSESRELGSLPESAEVLEAIDQEARRLDLVGLYAAGPIYRGFANSLGQRNWHERHSFHLDWSCHLRADKAVKAGYAGTCWSRAELGRRVAEVREQLRTLGLSPRRIPPGRYRAYLAPAALTEILHILGWGGFSLRAQHTQSSPLQRLVDGSARLHPAVTLVESTGEGTAPPFQGDGYARPPAVALVRRGEHAGSLVCPRSAMEYGVPGNGADAGEAPSALQMTAGDLPSTEVLQALDTGLYIGNLWYLSYSDRLAGRITGMTRFATFWVEAGRRVAPLEVMRFDDTVYEVLGTQLLALTRERELVPDRSTYGGRSTASLRLPGALLQGLRLTL